MENIKKCFIDLIGKDEINYIVNNNWTNFERLPFSICYKNEITINFLEKDGKEDTVIHCSIHYNEDTKKWWTENCISYPYPLFDTYKETIDHLKSLKKEIIKNGFTPIDIQ